MDTTRTPKTWTEANPMPDVPVLGGLRFDQYRDAMDTELLGEELGHINNLCRAVIHDPHGHRYAVVTSGFAECPRMFVCDGASVEMTAHSSTYSCDLHKAAAHVLTWLAFRDARRAGTLEPYWSVA